LHVELLERLEKLEMALNRKQNKYRREISWIRKDAFCTVQISYLELK